MADINNVIIIGSGPAGYTAAIYAARANLKPILVSGFQPGGQLTITTDVENYPGYEDPIQGPWLMEQMQKQAAHVGTEIINSQVTQVFLNEKIKKLNLDNGTTLNTKTVIISTGAQARWLGLENEAKFQGHGLSACATCDGFFFKDKNVIVVGGGDSAMEESLFLTKFAKKVTVVHRRDEFRASKIMQERVLNHEQIEVAWNKEVIEIKGDKQVSSVILKDSNSNEEEEKEIDGVFVRGIPGGTLEEICYHLDILHFLELEKVTVYNNTVCIEKSVDKVRTSCILNANGIKTPETFVTTNISHLKNFQSCLLYTSPSPRD